MTEEIAEEGVVVKLENNLAEIRIKDSDNCRECSAKIFCNSDVNSNARILKLKVSEDIRTNDRVLISISGHQLLKASFFIYFIPLIILIVTISLVISLLNQSEVKELLAFLTALIFVIVYFISLTHIGKRTLKSDEVIKIKKLNSSD